MFNDKSIQTYEVDKTKYYKVFISYCWSSPEHEAWVLDLAERLMSDGIEVKYDKWDLKEGQDKFAFMESMVTDETINKVLVICNKEYKEKADKRTGGVGTETQIITAELYNKIEQTKFIPIIAEQGEKFDSYMPIYIKSRIGIDLSEREKYEDGYEQLLRAIVERPKLRKPKLGNLPSYIFDDENNNYKTKSIIKSFQNVLYKNPSQALSFIDDFFYEFISILKTFQLEKEDYVEPYDEVIYNRIHEMLRLRNDYLDFLCSWLKQKDLFDIDKIISFFESIHSFIFYQGEGSYVDAQTDHYRFFLKEVFLYTIMFLLDKHYYENANILINNKYFVKDRCSINKEPHSFKQMFYCRELKSFSQRNQRLGTRFISPTTEVLMQRTTYNGIDFKNQIIETDLLLYYISHLQNCNYYEYWFPTTYIYVDDFYQYSKIEILSRLISKRHFEKTKVLFGVNTVDELKILFKSFNEEDNQNMRYSVSSDHVAPLSYHIDYDKIGTSI